MHRLKEIILLKNQTAVTRIINDLIAGIQYLTSNPDLGIKVKQALIPASVRDIFIYDYPIRYFKLNASIKIIKIWHQKKTGK